MTCELEGRVAIVTGAGNGLGRAYARFLAARGVRVVVNDLGGSVQGSGTDVGVAQLVVDEIVADGGVAVASTHDVADWKGAAFLVELAVDAFGSLDVLVNNAGIARQGELAEMREDDWDAMVRVHLKGHAAPTCHALAYWKARPPGQRRDASVVHTTSVAGLTATIGSGPYSAAKMGAIGLSKAVVGEGAAFGVRSNCVSPSAATRLTGQRSDLGSPDDVAPVVAWLAAAGCPANDQVVHVLGRRLVLLHQPALAADLVSTGERWTLEELEATLPGRLVSPVTRADMLARASDAGS